jgi:TatD DNase family protein
MNYKFIDSHSHITIEPLISDVEEVIKRVHLNNVEKIINICVDEKSLKEGIKLQLKHPEIYNVAATTPHDLKEDDSFFQYVEIAAQNKQLIAIGETGLDYYYKYVEKSLQKKHFIKYLQLAEKYNLPVVIHCRDAFSDLFDILDDFKHLKVLLHCFTGSKEEAKKALQRDLYISFSGIITFKNAFDLREVVKYVPLEKILIETDSPYLSPQNKRGKTNEPANVVEVAKTLSDVKKLSLEDIAFITFNNTSNFFQI